MKNQILISQNFKNSLKDPPFSITIFLYKNLIIESFNMLIKHKLSPNKYTILYHVDVMFTLR